MRLSPADQGSLLEVIEDYFSYPSASVSSVHDPEEFSDDDIDDVDDMESGTYSTKELKLIPRILQNKA